MENNKLHNLQIEYGSGFSASCVLEVNAFNEKEVKILLNSGQRLIVYGEKLKITCFNKQSGELKLSGLVLCVKYSPSVSSQIKKIFK